MSSLTPVSLKVRPTKSVQLSARRQASVATARTAVLYEKPRSVVRCDYVWRRTDRWITFPWSAEPPVGGGSIGGG